MHQNLFFQNWKGQPRNICGVASMVIDKYVRHQTKTTYLPVQMKREEKKREKRKGKEKIIQWKAYFWKLSSVTTYITRCVRRKMSHESFNCSFSFILAVVCCVCNLIQLGLSVAIEIYLFYFIFSAFLFISISDYSPICMW